MSVRLPIGIEWFREIREKGSYYVDKTGMIKELFDEDFKISLITRPRRFGKTLFMDTLREFFDIRRDSRELFEGLEISKYQELCDKWMNQYPVLFLTLKDIAGGDFAAAYGMLQFVVSSLCIEHSYLEDSERAADTDKEIFRRLSYREGTKEDIQSALVTLMRMMAAHFGKPVILLVDEYDVPLAKASDRGYYREMLDVIRGFLGMSWKSNPCMEFAVVTGCLRIAKESIFTGANNFVSNSVSNRRFDRYFGFTEEEVRGLLEATGLTEHLAKMKHWYDGYLFGEIEVYCPWDVVNHVSMLKLDPQSKPANYWKDTSHNEIIRSFIDLPGMDVRGKFETLLAGGVIQERIVEDMTYDLVNSSEENLWSILYLTGYLTRVREGKYPEGFQREEGTTVLRIPNEEVKTIFEDTIAKWFRDTVTGMDRRELLEAWWSGDDRKLTELVTDILFDTISYYDYKEDYYHAFTAGLFVGAGYAVSSNKEQGTGRADIVVKDRSNRRALIIEAKHSKKESDMERDCQEAIEQISRKGYVRTDLKGYRTILCYGAAFFEKDCLVRKC